MNSIRRRLTRDVLIVSALLLGGSLAALYFAARAELVEQFDVALEARALAFGAVTGADDGHLHLAEAVNGLPGSGKGKADEYYELWDANARVLARSSSLGATDLPRRTGSLERPRFWNLPLPDGRPGRAIGVEFKPRTDAGGRGRNPPWSAVLMVVAGDRGNLDEALSELLAIGGVCGVLLLAATLGTVPRVLRRGLAPLARLGEQAAQIDADTLAARFPATGLPDELLPICARLNALLARLEESFARERRFSADLAHELRTPLAELRSLAECALKWPETRDTTTDRDTLAAARQMESLVTNLLALARGEHGQLAAHREPVAVDALVRDGWRPFAARAETRGLRADLVVAPASALADPVLLRSILANLFDNAVDYAPAGGTITITGEAGPAGVTLRVANATHDLDPADVGRLFDRFWRKEAARSGGQHTGLGLPLARMFASAMDWTLTAALDAEHRLVFTLQGPVAS